MTRHVIRRQKAARISSIVICNQDSYCRFWVKINKVALVSVRKVIESYWTPHYRKDSLTLVGAVALGTGVMIGAGIFALTGQMAQMTGSLFPLAFLSAAAIVSFSAYSYVKMSNAYPSAGGIAMYLEKAYGRTVTTAFHSLLMYFSMVIAQSFLARTFGA